MLRGLLCEVGPSVRVSQQAVSLHKMVVSKKWSVAPPRQTKTRTHTAITAFTNARAVSAPFTFSRMSAMAANRSSALARRRAVGVFEVAGADSAVDGAEETEEAMENE